jgi:hypothetical protein
MPKRPRQIRPCWTRVPIIPAPSVTFPILDCPPCLTIPHLTWATRSDWWLVLNRLAGHFHTHWR